MGVRLGLYEDLANADVVVVGAGFFGCTIAERVATALGKNVVVLEKRNHIGGNAYSYKDPLTGIDVHKYGTHIFHTSNQRIIDYVTRFTTFNSYRHSVKTNFRNFIYDIPINLKTLNDFYGRSFSPTEAIQFLAEKKTFIDTPRNFEEQALNSIGNELYEAFFKGYTQKQWSISPSELPAEVFSRIPVRFNYDNNYFNDQIEGIPSNGYLSLFQSMLSHPKIKTHLGVDYFNVREIILSETLIVYSGPIDRLFDYQFGTLNWRTVDLKFETVPTADYQGCAVMNFADESIPYTRIHEFKHLHPENVDLLKLEQTIVAREYSRFAGKEDDPYYPMNTKEDQSRVGSYKDLALGRENLIIGGRLGSYKYLDMHMAIGQALMKFENEIAPRLTRK